MSYPKRLIEVDLPIKRISAHARREKSIRHGHISTLHIWWARRPLAACRAVICASLWPDPADENCPQAFRDAAARLITEFAEKVYNTTSLHATASKESFGQWEGIVTARKQGIELDPTDATHLNKLRFALFDFIADFANWDNSTVKEYLETSRGLTQAAHEALGGTPGTRPLVVDPFAGGGSIPLEALRVGADAFASDLNPVAVLINKVVLQYIPKYGRRLADDVRKWGEWIKREAEKELAEFYPKDPDGATPITYLWARTIQCEGPGCGTEVPLIRSLWLAKKSSRSVALQLLPRPKAKRVDFRIVVKQRDGWGDQDDPKTKIENPKFDGTVKRGSATCPCCGYTTPVARVREQLKKRRGGWGDARLYCIVSTRNDAQGRFYRPPNVGDEIAARKALTELERRRRLHKGPLSYVPNESTKDYHSFVNRGPIYGMCAWDDYFTPRQSLALGIIARLISEVGRQLDRSEDQGIAEAVQTCLALNFGRVADLANNLCGWTLDTQCVKHLFARQAIPMVWNFAESVLIGESAGSWTVVAERFPEVLASLGCDWSQGTVQQADAAAHPLPSDSAQAVLTDPPYYFSVQYADLSDFFYVWLRRTLHGRHAGLLDPALSPKEAEIIVQSPGHEFAAEGKNNAFYESRMSLAMAEARRVLEPSGIAMVVFAHTSTKGWESQLQSMVVAGWVVTGSWPIDTEMASRVLAQGRAVLGSSVHIICRPREDANGSVRTDIIGDWRDILAELPRRIHEWMPRLAAEGVVGADAIFACLGPALEIFSRYSRVEKSDGSVVPLREFLEHVWAAVSKEALSMIFKDADAAGLEADARVTAMWLWTLGTTSPDTNGNGPTREGREEEAEAEDEEGERNSKVSGFVLEFDAARKIAQGLGADLEKLRSVVEVKAETARLLSVAERGIYLLGKPTPTTGSSPARRSPKARTGYLPGMEEARQRKKQPYEMSGDAELGSFQAGSTTLDRIHQSMILFGRGRGDALRSFLVDDGIGKDARFWKLAQSLSALYPPGTDEKRWVDGVLARKKGLGL